MAVCRDFAAATREQTAMLGGGLQFRIRRAALAAAFLCLSSLTLSACASSTYAGIPLTAGAADPELQALAQRAQAGDKHAQLELGIRYEEGRGVSVDLGRATTLYRIAAADTGGDTLIYSPPVGKNDRGRVLPVNTGIRQEGLAEARSRLQSLALSDD